MELSPENLIVIGLVASVVTQALRLLASRFGYTASREVVNVALFALSVGLAAWFFGLPAVGGTDPSEFAQALVQAAAAVFGSAALIYNVLLNKVLLPVEK
jgi:hypothetical protein